MIKLLTAYTCELSDSEKAVQDISNRLDLKSNLLKNAVALLFCRVEFIESGVAEKVSKSLPFDILGCTSQYFALGPADTAAGEHMLTVTVLTSDDIEFVTGLSEPLSGENTESVIRSLYQNTAVSLGGEPSLIFAFQPTMIDLTNDVMTGALDRACGGIPIFGSVALDIDVVVRNPRVMYQGAAYNDRTALLLFKGPVKPNFFSFLFPGKTIFDEDAVVTAAEGNRILSINNEPAVVFLEKLGLLQSGSYTLAIPLVIEGPDDTGPRPIVLYGIDGEVLLCSRNIQAGGSLSVGMVTRDVVFESMGNLIQVIKKEENGTGFFIFSCGLRAIVLEGNPMAEIELMQKELGDFPCPYLYISSGGEICPQLTKSGKTVNGLYQYALIACQFR